jgi:ankyrin repeat protein
VQCWSRDVLCVLTQFCFQIKQCLAKGASPSVTDKEGRTGAHFAASRGDLATLRLLHNSGASLVTADHSGRTPLHNAASRDRTSAITYLVHTGAKVNVCDAAGCSPLHLAARSGSVGATCRLLDLGATAHMSNKCQLTALGANPIVNSFCLCSNGFETHVCT